MRSGILYSLDYEMVFLSPTSMIGLSTLLYTGHIFCRTEVSEIVDVYTRIPNTAATTWYVAFLVRYPVVCIEDENTKSNTFRSPLRRC